MNRRAWLLISISFMIAVNSGIGSDTNQGSSSPITGTAIIAVSDFNFPGTSKNVGHVAILFENPEDHSYTFFSVQAKTQYAPITPVEIKGLTIEEAEQELVNRGYTGYKTYEVKDPKFENAVAKSENIYKESYDITASTPIIASTNIGVVSNCVESLTGFGIYDNCLTAGVKILESYGAEMPPTGSSGLFYPSKPKDYYEKFPGEEEYELSSTENKYISTATDTSSKSSSEESDLGGINFTSINLNYISVTTDNLGGVNLDIGLKAQKADGTSSGVNITNATRIGLTAFITGLAVPNEKFWVGLSPWEPDRIIDQQLSESDVGRILLEADLQMKKDVCNYCNPCANETGKAYWDLFESKREELAQQCMNKYPGEIGNTDNVYFRPDIIHCIIPDKVYAYTNDTEIYIINYTLTINSESDIDHSTFELNNQDAGALSRGCFEELNRSAKEFSQYTSELDDSMILPYVIWDVNHADRYEDLRNVFVALALAQWYKSKITPDMDIFRDIYSSDYTVSGALQPWSFQEIWEDYVYSCENREYICWENTTVKTATGTRTICNPRSRGGVTFRNINSKIIEIEGMPPEVRDRVNSAVLEGFVDAGDEVLFGNRFHENRSQNAPVSESGSGPVPTVTEAAHDSNESIIDDGKGYDDEVAPVTCPEGWMGPDENGECWKMQILS